MISYTYDQKGLYKSLSWRALRCISYFGLPNKRQSPKSNQSENTCVRGQIHMHIYVLMFKDQMRTSSIMLCYYSSYSLGKGSLNEPGTRLAEKLMQFSYPSYKIPGLYVAILIFLGEYQGFELQSSSLLSICPYPPSNLPRQIWETFLREDANPERPPLGMHLFGIL